MKRFNQLLDETNDTRLKIYFNLSELKEITGLSDRALKYRMLYVKKKYNEVPSLLAKKDRKWKIHYSIVNEFEPKYKIKNTTAYNYNWESMATWNPKFNYDEAVHTTLVNEIKKKLPTNKISYAIEKDGRGTNHTHIVSDANVPELTNAVNETIRKYIGDSKDCRVLVENIYNKYSAIQYIRKAPLSFGTL